MAVKIPGLAIKLAESGRKDETEIEFVAQIRDSKGRLAASVRDNLKAFESEPARIRKVSGTKMPIELSVPLQSLAPGRYTMQLTVVDEIGKKFAFVRSGIVILERRSEVSRT